MSITQLATISSAYKYSISMESETRSMNAKTILRIYKKWKNKKLVQLCQLLTFCWSIPLTSVAACVFLCWSPSGFSQIIKHRLTDKPVSGSGNFSLPLLFLHPLLLQLCPSVTCSPLPLWLSFFNTRSLFLPLWPYSAFNYLIDPVNIHWKRQMGREGGRKEGWIE